jgi:CRISPR-associated protein (TIGR03986 family)
MAKQNYKKSGSKNSNVEKNFYNPYAFVPLSEKVYLLSKEELKDLEQVHDVPFKDGISGKIVVDFEAITPICVKSSQEKNTNVEGRYFISGTSLKGMIRSVFEIITLSNFRNGIANSRLSMRDLRSDDYVLKAPKKTQKSGLLIQLNNEFYILPCDSKALKYSDIEKQTMTKDLKYCKSISEKYKKIPSVFEQGGKYSMWFFSGFMNNKEHEFLFDIPMSFNSEDLIPLQEDEYQDFRFIHEIENKNASWTYWKKKIKNYSSVDAIKSDSYGGIAPCFFREFTKAGKQCVKDLGFAFLYRQPYPKKMHDFLPSSHTEGGVDLPQSVFGYVKGEKALKGRVQFGNAFIDNAKIEAEEAFVLGSPKPSFYPFYVEQKGEGKLETYFSKTAKLSGYKRYIVHQKCENGVKVPDKNKRVVSIFRPLSAGTKFSETIYFHNLKDYELGALLAAITFCNKYEKCYHSLGYAKPFGYGKLKVRGVKVDSDSNESDETLYGRYVSKMCERLKLNDEQALLNLFGNLFLWARGNYESRLDGIRYPDMQKKEFNEIKNKKYSIKDFSPKKN